MLYFFVAIVILALIGIASFSFLMKTEADKKYASMRLEYDEQEARHLAANEEVRARIARLEKYEHIPGIIEKSRRAEERYAARYAQIEKEAREHAAAIISEAALIAENTKGAARKEAEDIRSVLGNERRATAERVERAKREAQIEADAIRAKAKADVKDSEQKLKANAQKIENQLVAASTYAAEVRARAEIEARAIAGKAYEAREKADHFAAVADAMHHAIEGYRNRYAGSEGAILDQLTEEYSFSKAGEKLALARERVRLMERERTAARCDYAEASRREFAINFLLDAFNGKAETIFAKVKHDNYGSLRKRLEDAFHLVNFNGKAFKDARITKEFLDARLDELKWAAAVQELRLRDREEQRAIQEQIRDEEKARREYDRAIKQAERDEAVLKKALDKARADFEAANAEQRGHYEARLQEVAKRLQEAEEKNKKAISMAQLTRCGYVYVISNIGSLGENIYKIGLTRRLEPMDRVRELGDASVPFGFDVHAFIYSEDAPALETALHRKFVAMQVNKANRRKEFFRVGLGEIRQAAAEMNLDVKWTLQAEAREYYETLALERAMQEDPDVQRRWTEAQQKLAPPPSFDEEAEPIEEEEMAEMV